MEDNLERFVTAQEAVFEDVCAELSAGRKRSHWMWFIFPQLRALGRSSTAQFYGLADLAEAQAFWQHRVLGPRLRRVTTLVLGVTGRSAHDIFGSPDDLKLCSCMTLFERATSGETIFAQVLDRFYAGRRDALTVAALDA